MIRWVFDFYFFSIRIHHWLHSDDLRYPHDHPWSFITFCISGQYTDISPDCPDDIIKSGSFRFRNAAYKHSVRVDKSCWTILLTGPSKRMWGFWVKGKFRKRNKYFYIFGHHHPCDE